MEKPRRKGDKNTEMLLEMRPHQFKQKSARP